MIKNYFKIAFRNLARNKVFSMINIMGLTIGITVCMMIFLFIMNEFSFDQFHSKEKNIYRVMRGFSSSNLRVPYLAPPYATALLNDYPNEIKKAVRVLPNSGLLSFGNKAFNEQKLYLADNGFFNIFSFGLLKGDPSTVLKEPGSIVLTESTAKKYFGNEDPIGKVIELDKHLQLKVTGIAKDMRPDSHLDFDMVVPLSNYYHEEWFKGWNNNNGFTYVLLDDHVTKAQMEARFPAFVKKYVDKELAAMGAHVNLSLTPLKDIYFEPSSAFDHVKHGDRSVVYIFLSIALLILIIACINFTNLSTIRAIDRSKEVGLRKVMGALRNQLVWQFIGESILLTLISCVLAIGLLQLLMPTYNELLGYSLNISWSSPYIYMFLAGVILIAGILAGSYPAFFLSAFSPVQALKGKLKLGKGGAFFRQSLVVVQFSISVLLIIGTVIIVKQMDYVKTKELGYNQDQTVVVKLDNNDIYDKRVVFKNELQNKNNIGLVSLMSGEPGGFFDGHNFEVEGQTAPVNLRTVFSDLEYVKMLGLKIIAGRDLSPAFATDSTDAVLINRTAAAKLGFKPEEAIGKNIKNLMREDHTRKIVGVVEDFNFLSLKEKMDPLVISPGDDNRVVTIKLKTGNIQSALADIKRVYASVAPVYPFEYSFLDQKFADIYKTDLRQQKILSIFSGLAIFIACLGLFGLASFTISKRIKEIGVRKVLGSSVKNIVLLLSKDLLKPVLIATIIAIPIGYYVMHSWLENFAYRTPLTWWVFALASLVTVVIALITVSFKAIKAALSNPIQSLRTE